MSKKKHKLKMKSQIELFKEVRKPTPPPTRVENKPSRREVRARDSYKSHMRDYY